MALDIYKVSADTLGGMNILVYGEAGVGKTTFAAGAQDIPAMRDTLFLNLEKGLKSVADRPDISAVDVDDPGLVEDVYQAFKRDDAQVSGFKTLVIDSIGELQELDLEKRAAKKGGKRTMDMYGDSTAYFKRLFRQLRDLQGLNVILLAQTTQRVDDSTGKVSEIYPNLTAKLATNVMAYQDAVWFLYTRQLKDSGTQQRVMLTEPVGAYKAKTRGKAFAEALGGKVEDPNLADLYALYTADAAGVA